MRIARSRQKSCHRLFSFSSFWVACLLASCVASFLPFCCCCWWWWLVGWFWFWGDFGGIVYDVVVVGGVLVLFLLVLASFVRFQSQFSGLSSFLFLTIQTASNMGSLQWHEPQVTPVIGHPLLKALSHHCSSISCMQDKLWVNGYRVLAGLMFQSHSWKPSLAREYVLFMFHFLNYQELSLE